MATSIGDPDGPCLTVFTQKEVIALSFTILAGFMSTAMVLILLGRVARNFARNVKDPPPGGKWRLIRTHIDAYLLSLLGSEILQGIGAIMNVKWVFEGGAHCSDYCSVQGALKTIGETGVGMNTMAIAIHTFIVVFFWWIPSPRSVWIYRVVITLIWSYPVIFVIVASYIFRADNPTDADVLFSPTPYWCWISGGDLERIFGEYLWLILAVLLSAVLYTLLYFRLRGNIQVDPQNWKHVHVQLHRDSQDQPTVASREAMGVVIWYPICYCFIAVPLIIVRWIYFHPPNGYVVEFAMTAIAITLFAFSGVVSVILILRTRRDILLLGPSRGVVKRPSRQGIQ